MGQLGKNVREHIEIKKIVIMLNIQRNVILNILQWEARACYVEQWQKKIKKKMQKRRVPLFVFCKEKVTK